MTATPPLTLACLCAGWCGTCTAYRAVFDAAAQSHPHWRLVWIDVEDDADALSDALGEAPDIENFPTLMLLRGSEPLFLGPVLPHAPVLARLLTQAESDGLRPLADPVAKALAPAVLALAQG